MSLINKMLQELDKRHAADGDGKTLTQHLRPVPARKNWELFWRIMAGIMVFVVGWIIWVLYQISPRPIVTDLAFESQGKIRQSAAAPVAAAGAPAPAATVVPPAEPKAESAPSQPASPTPPAATKAVELVNVDMLKLATEIATPFTEKSFRVLPKAEPKPAPASKETPRKVAEAAPVPATKASAATPKPANDTAVPEPAQAAVLKAETRLPEPRRGPVSIDKQDRIFTAQQRAEGEFRRGTGLLNQGRVAEAVDAYKLALLHDATHESARQALVALLLETKHADEAQAVLQQGLAVNPARSGYAMLLARMLVDRGDLPGAYDLLQRHAGGAADNPDYHAFSAALLQRMGRNKDAVSEYQAAVRLAPNAGVWWMGMGISLQADNRRAEALEAFRRASAAGGLNSELQTFVDQRLKQLQ